MSIFTSKNERVRFLKFAFVGFTGALVDFGILNLLRVVFKMPLIWAQAISFTVAVINNFTWNRFWTYPDSRTKKVSNQLFQFFIINTIGILIRTPLISWLDKLLFQLIQNLNWTLPLDNYIVSQNLALAISIFIIMLWNYFANRYWTYADVPQEQHQQTPNETKNLKNG